MAKLGLPLLCQPSSHRWKECALVTRLLGFLSTWGHGAPETPVIGLGDTWVYSTLAKGSSHLRKYKG